MILSFASASFVDDVTLAATSLEEVAFLVDGCHQWCGLLGVKLNRSKTQVWITKGAVRRITLKFGGESVTLPSHATFCVVGIDDWLTTNAPPQVRIQPPPPLGEGAPDWVASRQPRCPSRGLCEHVANLDPSTRSVWFGDLPHNPAQLRPLCMQDKNLVTQKLNISTLAAPEVLGGLPLGACAARDPRLEAPVRRLLRNCMAAFHHESGVGSFSHKPLGLLEDLRRRCLDVSQLSKVDIMAFVERQTVDVRRHLGDLICAHRAERVARWKPTVARLWEEKLSVVHRLLSGDTPAWGSYPILSTAGARCTTGKR